MGLPRFSPLRTRMPLERFHERLHLPLSLQVPLPLPLLRTKEAGAGAEPRILRLFRKFAQCCRARPRSRSSVLLKSGPRLQRGPSFLGYKGEDSQMTLSLLLSILLMPGAGLAEGGIVAGTLRGPDGSPAARVRVQLPASTKW